MKIALIGATGNTGLHFVKQALAKGHSVTALVRSPQKLALDNPQLTVIVGDVLNADDVSRTVAGQDAVFIALGTGKIPKKSSIRADGTRQVVNALAASGETPHVVVLSSLGVGDSKKQFPSYWNWLLSLLMRYAFADHSQQEAVVRASSLPWTILRPTSMSDKPGTGHATATPTPESVKVLPRVARADVAAFALNTIEKRNNYHRALALTPYG